MSVFKKVSITVAAVLTTAIIIWSVTNEFGYFFQRLKQHNGNVATTSTIAVNNPTLDNDQSNFEESHSQSIYFVQNFKYTLLSVNKTKDFSNLNVEEFYLPGRDRPNQPLMEYLSNKSYVSATLTIQNMSNEIVNANIGSHTLALITEKKHLFREICYFSLGDLSQLKNYYYCTFQPNEMLTITLGYVVEDALVEDNKLAILLNMNGYDYLGKDVEYIYINQIGIGEQNERYITSRDEKSGKQS